MAITLVLPYPPSVNGYWRHFRGRFCVSKEGQRYRQNVEAAVVAERVKPMTGRLAVEIELYPPDRRRRDIDNVLKGLLDSLQHGGCYADDSQIDRLCIRRGMVRNGDGRCLVVIEVA